MHIRHPNLHFVRAARHRTARRRIARPLGRREHALGARPRVQRRSVALPRRPRRQKHGRRPPLRARPPARQQIQREHQNPAQISELEYPVPPRNTADEMIVNLDSVPWLGNILTPLWPLPIPLNSMLGLFLVTRPVMARYCAPLLIWR